MKKFLRQFGQGLIWIAGFILAIGIIRLTVDFIAVCWRLWGKVV